MPNDCVFLRSGNSAYKSVKAYGIASAFDPYTIDSSRTSDVKKPKIGDIFLSNINDSIININTTTPCKYFNFSVTDASLINTLSVTKQDILSYKIPSYKIPSYKIPSYKIPSYKIPSYKIPSYKIPNSGLYYINFVTRVFVTTTGRSGSSVKLSVMNSNDNPII
jgi:hypothetical protein